MPLFAQSEPKKEPVDYVNPNIGGIGHLLRATAPLVFLPHGMVSLAPVTPRLIVDRYLADKILGFPAGGATLMATAGPLETDQDKAASSFDHDLETATPYYYSVLLEKYDIEAEYTVSQHAVHFRFAFPEKTPAHLLWRGREIRVTGPASIEGGQAGRQGRQTYFVAEFSKPFALPDSGGRVADESVTAMTLAPAKGERIGVRVGISHLSVDQARRNLAREMPDWNFDAARQRARDVWNRALGRIQVKGGSEEERTIFYTALYRSLWRMQDITEDGQYIGFDGQVHAADGHPYYTGDGLWDTYRSLQPLQTILEPERQDDVIRSYIRMYEQSGWMPSFPGVGGARGVMIGHHAAALVADAYFKGYRDFDVEKAYEGLKKNAMEATMLPFRNGPATSLERVYLEKGFFPALGNGEEETVSQVHPFERRQAVSVTLENCYDDWCVAQLAKALKKDADYAYFMKRAANYRNVFDARIGFMAPKTADGQWIEPFDPMWASGPGGRDYFTEGNSWTYTFHVQHDIAGLIRLMGGREKFLARLDALFVEQYGFNKAKHHFLGNFPDMTGLIGQYGQGNEPSFHIPYLYCYAGEPWKTQRKVREIMRLWYTDTPLGICGDEDGGAMSSWYVLSAMGFYAVCPGRPVYVIGSPIFEETRIALGEGKVFTITAKDVSAKNKYIQSAQLNGQPLHKPWFSHADLVPGGTLVLQMGPRPNRSWGSAADAAPPSMSDE